MNSRMDKYEEERPKSRTARNKDLYNEINKTEISKFNSFNNAKVIDESAKEIDLNKIKKYIDKLGTNKMPERKSLLDATDMIKDIQIKEEEEKDYDLISVLEKAREKREVDYEKEKYKKLRDTQYDILNNLKVSDITEAEPSEETYNTKEKTLIDLINTVALNRDKNNLLSDLTSENDETLIGSIEEESSNNDLRALINDEINKTKTDKIPEQITKEIEPVKNIDNSFYTSSMNFSKEDFEDFDDIKGRSNFVAKIGIIILIMCILGVLILIANFIFDLNII